MDIFDIKNHDTNAVYLFAILIIFQNDIEKYHIVLRFYDFKIIITNRWYEIE